MIDTTCYQISGRACRVKFEGACSWSVRESPLKRTYSNPLIQETLSYHIFQPNSYTIAQANIPSALIRDATIKDLACLAEVAKAGFSSSPVYKFVRVRADQFPNDVLAAYRAEMISYLRNPRCLVKIAEVNDKIIGYAVWEAGKDLRGKDLQTTILECKCIFCMAPLLSETRAENISEILKPSLLSYSTDSSSQPETRHMPKTVADFINRSGRRGREVFLTTAWPRVDFQNGTG